jgi:hypothetical protein
MQALAVSQTQKSTAAPRRRAQANDLERDLRALLAEGRPPAEEALALQRLEVRYDASTAQLLQALVPALAAGETTLYAGDALLRGVTARRRYLAQVLRALHTHTHTYIYVHIHIHTQTSHTHIHSLLVLCASLEPGPHVALSLSLTH